MDRVTEIKTTKSILKRKGEIQIEVQVTKQCFRCKTTKSIESFTKGMYECKPCSSKARLKYRKKQYPVIAAKNQVYRQRNQRFVYEYLFEHPCIDCGESDLVVLEFDHINDNKFASIAKLMTSSRSLEVLKTEMDKCEVVCCNCHRKRTANRGQWMKLHFSSFTTGEEVI